MFFSCLRIRHGGTASADNSGESFEASGMPSSRPAIAHRTLQPGTQFSPRETSAFFPTTTKSNFQTPFFFPKFGEQFSTPSLDSTEKSMHSAHSFRCSETQRDAPALPVAGIHPARESHLPKNTSKIRKKSSQFKRFLPKNQKTKFQRVPTPPVAGEHPTRECHSSNKYLFSS